MSNPHTLATLLAEHRQNTGDSYGAIARRSGLSKAAVAAFGTGSRTLARPATIEKLAVGLSLPPSVVKAAAYRSAGVQPDEQDAPFDPSHEVAVERLLQLPDAEFQDAAQYIAYLHGKATK